MPQPLTLLACKLDLPLPTPAWLQYHPPSSKQDFRVGTAVSVFIPDGAVKGPSGLINGIVKVSPRWVALTGWDDEERTAFLILAPRKWTKCPPIQRGFLSLHANRPRGDDTADFPVPITLLDKSMRTATEEWLGQASVARGEQRKWMGLGGVRVSVETKVVGVTFIPRENAVARAM